MLKYGVLYFYYRMVIDNRGLKIVLTPPIMFKAFKYNGYSFRK